MKPFVSVTWLDAHTNATLELEEHELPRKPAQYTLHGLLVFENEEGVLVASEETPAKTYRGWTFVPRVLVQDIKYLQKPRAPRKKRPVIDSMCAGDS